MTRANRLAKDTQAVQIHGRTGQAIAELTLPAGTNYTVQKSHEDALGHRWQRILVDGYVYDVER